MKTGNTIILKSSITCPECGHTETETMPTNACQWFYDCKGSNPYSNPHWETVAYIAPMERFHAHLYRKERTVVKQNNRIFYRNGYSLKKEMHNADDRFLTRPKLIEY